jgi:PTH1 family peptidyl-tRNA hydrolase
MQYLIIGLGNIGPEYKLTRHNIGFQVIDQLASAYKVQFSFNRLAHIVSFAYEGRNIYLMKPTTYMNNSGRAVHYWLNQLKIPIANSLTVVDDIFLPFCDLRIRAQGSSGGHNGLKSLELWLKTQQYPRLRFGIGNNFTNGQQADYVLKAFTKEELPYLPHAIDQCCEKILSFCSIN